MSESSKKQMLIDLFWKEEDYRDFLSIVIEKKLSGELPSKAKIASIIGVSSPYISKVLAKDAHLSYDAIALICDSLDFQELERLTFLDKLTLARAESDELRSFIKKRIETQFYQKIDKIPEQKRRSNERLHTFKFFNLIDIFVTGREYTLKKIAEKIGASEERAKVIIDEFSRYFNLESRKFENHTLYKVQPGASSSSSFTSNLEFFMSLRRLASYSFEKRFPIHIIDEEFGRHYSSVSFLKPLTQEQAAEISLDIARLVEKINNIKNDNIDKDELKTIGMCFDVFDSDV